MIDKRECFEELFRKEMDLLSFQLEEKQINQFYEYFQLLVEWNGFMNLTSIVEMDEVVTKHFADSLSLVKAVQGMGEKEYKVIDIGTGAGFPGIPLKIAFPQLKIVLMDSLNKRIKFLNEVISKLGLDRIEAVHGRAEDLGRDPLHREQYDFCVSRAVAKLSILSEYCLPFVKIGGSFISYKSGNIVEELEEAKHALFLLGGRVEGVVSFQLPGTEAKRSLVKTGKVSATARKYPRKAGVPGKEPLK